MRYSGHYQHHSSWSQDGCRPGFIAGRVRRVLRDQREQRQTGTRSRATWLTSSSDRSSVTSRRDSATIWIETDQPCKVRVLDTLTSTFSGVGSNQIAQKLHACTEPLPDGNDWVRDIIDVWPTGPTWCCQPEVRAARQPRIGSIATQADSEVDPDLSTRFPETGYIKYALARSNGRNPWITRSSSLATCRHRPSATWCAAVIFAHSRVDLYDRRHEPSRGRCRSPLAHHRRPRVPGRGDHRPLRAHRRQGRRLPVPVTRRTPTRIRAAGSRSARAPRRRSPRRRPPTAWRTLAGIEGPSTRREHAVLALTWWSATAHARRSRDRCLDRATLPTRG